MVSICTINMKFLLVDTHVRCESRFSKLLPNNCCISAFFFKHACRNTHIEYIFTAKTALQALAKKNVTSDTEAAQKPLTRLIENATCLQEGWPIACTLAFPPEPMERMQQRYAICSSAYWRLLTTKAWCYLKRERRPRFKILDFPYVARDSLLKITNVSRFSSQLVTNHHQSGYVVCCTCFSISFAPNRNSLHFRQREAGNVR